MFEPNMDEYLDEEVETAKQMFETICRDWERQVSPRCPNFAFSLICVLTDALIHQLSQSTSSSSTAAGGPDSQARFLTSHNPAQVKRNFIASFTDVLLLPVTIVPYTVTAVAGGVKSGASAAASGISMLNPQRWGGNSGAGSGGRAGTGNGYGVAGDDYSGGAALFEVGDDEDEDVPQGFGAKPKNRHSVKSSIDTISSLGMCSAANVLRLSKL